MGDNKIDKDLIEKNISLGKCMDSASKEFALAICGCAAELQEENTDAQGEADGHEFHKLITTGMAMELMELIIMSHCVGDDDSDVLREQCAKNLFRLGAICLSNSPDANVVVDGAGGDDIGRATLESAGAVKH